jgi:N-acetyl-gamma-glutamyl-phosphate reductase
VVRICGTLARDAMGGAGFETMTNVFIDGQAGTTGLQIRERLARRGDVTLIEIPESLRKDPEVRRRYLNEADVVILCLPDDAAREAMRLISSNHVRVLDASTAYRVAGGWVYGLPELDAHQRERIREAARVSNPGCYPTGFVLLTRPLVDAGVLSHGAHLSCHAISGYSGGGRRLIERYEARSAEHPESLWHVRPYALNLDHKHLPEMSVYSGIGRTPVFSPMVGHFAQGMLTMVPLHTDLLGEGDTVETVHACLEARYRDEPCVEVFPLGAEDALDAGFLDPQSVNGTNRIELFVYGHDTQIMLAARLDNLGKGASGAAVQNLNIMTGADELSGLAL